MSSIARYQLLLWCPRVLHYASIRRLRAWLCLVRNEHYAEVLRRQIVLAVSARLQCIRMSFYFAFASGALAYDCLSCGAECCKGHGYALGGSESIDRLLQAAPALRLFVDRKEKSGSSVYSVGNCPPGCFFLGADLRCRIHKEEGYGAKPQTCRLFPFNNIKRVRPYVVVAPHLGLCPLTVSPVDRVAPESVHEQLADAMSGLDREMDLREAFVPYRVQSIIELERAIVRLSNSFDDSEYRRFASSQIEATDVIYRSGLTPTGINDRSLKEFTRSLHETLGGAPSSKSLADAFLARTMAVTTPTLRAELLFQDSSRPPGATVGISRLPHFMLALHTLAAFALDAGMRQVSYQTLVRLFLTNRALLALLAHVDAIMAWHPNASLDLTIAGDRNERRRYLELVQTLLPSRQRKNALTLGHILAQGTHSNSLENTLFLKRIAPRLVSGLAQWPCTDVGASRRLSIRRALQRTFIDLASVEVLAVAATKMERRTAAKTTSSTSAV